MEHLQAEVFHFPEPEPVARLGMALRALTAALDEQRDAVADFRASLRSLRGATEGLAASFVTYQGNLETLDSQVHHLRQTVAQG